MRSAFAIMDPLTIGVTVAGLVRTCGTAVTMCSGLITKYKTAPAILASIRTECITVKSALSYVDWIIKRDADLLSSQFQAHSPLLEIFDVPLNACVLTFSLLDIELQKLYDRSKDHDSFKWKNKMKYVWNEDQAKTILDHMRGLQSALNLMLTALQTYVFHIFGAFLTDHKLIMRRSSTSALIPLLQEQKPVIERVRKNTRSIRESLISQFDPTTNENRRAFSEKSSFIDSIIGDEEFSFDDEIINTFAYRNAMKRLVSKAKGAQQNANLDERHILDEPLNDLEELPQTQSELKANSTASSNRQCPTSNMTSTRTALHGYTVMKDSKPLIPTSIESPSQPTSERHTAIDSSCMEGSSAYLGDHSRDADEVIRQRVQDDEYRGARRLHRSSRKPVQASYRPLNSFDQSSRPDADTTKSLRKKSRSRHPLERKDKLALVVEEQVAREEPNVVPPSSPRTPASTGEIFETYHGNTAYNDLESEQVETRREYAANSFQDWVERYMEGGQYDHKSNTKASEDGKIPSRFLVEEVSKKGLEPIEEKDISTNQVTYKEEPSEHEQIISSSLFVETWDRDSIPSEEEGILYKVIPKDQIRPRKASRGSNREIINGKRSPNGEGIPASFLTTSALKHHERGQSSRRGYQIKRVQDSNEESEQGLSHPSNIEPKPGDKIASKIARANSKLLETVENAIEYLIFPELAALKLAQSMKRRDQLPEPNRADVITSPVAKSLRPPSVYDTPERSKTLPNRDGSNTGIRRRARHVRGSKDGNHVTTSVIKPGTSHYKVRDETSTHASHRFPASTSIKRFEDRRGDIRSRPRRRVKLMPPDSEDPKEVVQAQRDQVREAD